MALAYARGACMHKPMVRTRSGGVLPLLVSLGTMQGCATNKSPLATASSVDREFAAAAVTWDLNRDGNVTCDEWKQYAADLFRAADVNRDGVLTREEFTILTRQDRLFEVAGFSYFDA